MAVSLTDCWLSVVLGVSIPNGADGVTGGLGCGRIPKPGEPLVGVIEDGENVLFGQDALAHEMDDQGVGHDAASKGASVCGNHVNAPIAQNLNKIRLSYT